MSVPRVPAPVIPDILHAHHERLDHVVDHLVVSPWDIVLCMLDFRRGKGQYDRVDPSVPLDCIVENRDVRVEIMQIQWDVSIRQLGQPLDHNTNPDDRVEGPLKPSTTVWLHESVTVRERRETRIPSVASLHSGMLGQDIVPCYERGNGMGRRRFGSPRIRRTGGGVAATIER